MSLTVRLTLLLQDRIARTWIRRSGWTLTPARYGLLNCGRASTGCWWPPGTVAVTRPLKWPVSGLPCLPQTQPNHTQCSSNRSTRLRCRKMRQSVQSSALSPCHPTNQVRIPVVVYARTRIKYLKYLCALTYIWFLHSL